MNLISRNVLTFLDLLTRLTIAAIFFAAAASGTRAQSAAQWQFGIGNVSGVGIAHADLIGPSGLIATMRCRVSGPQSTAAGVDPTPGVLTVQLAPSAAGNPMLDTSVVGFRLEGVPELELVFRKQAAVGAFAAQLSLNRRISDSLERGTGVDLTPQFGPAMRTRMPQSVSAGIAQACGAMGLDPAIRPATDCARAGQVTEVAICSVPALARLDRQIAEAYAGASGLAKASQKSWLEKRDGCSGREQCLTREMKARLAQLGGPRAGSAQAGMANAPVAAAGQGFAVAPQAPAGDVIVGNDKVGDQFMFWAIGNHPELAGQLAVQQMMAERPMPPGVPPLPKGTISGPPVEKMLLAAGAIEKDKPPRHVILEQPFSLSKGADQKYRVQANARFDGVPAITQIAVTPRARLNRLLLNAQHPFYLPTNDTLQKLGEMQVRSPEGQMLLKVALEISNLHPEISGGYVNGGTGDMTISSVTAVFRPRVRGPNGNQIEGPDQVLYTWQSGAIAARKIAKPASADNLAQLFGGGISGGRYVVNAYGAPEQAVRIINQPLLKGAGNDGLKEAFALSAIIGADPKRPLSIDLAQRVVRDLLTEVEATQLFSLDVLGMQGRPAANELKRRAAFSRNDAALRERVTERVPGLPLALRAVGSVPLDKYDFNLGGFPLLFNGFDPIWQPRNKDGQPLAKALPKFLEMSPDAGGRLLDAMTAAGMTEGRRFVFVVLDYDLVSVHARPVRTGPITEAELSKVRFVSKPVAAALYADPRLKQKIADLALPAGFSPDESGADPLPDDIFRTTGRSLLGAVAQLDDNGDVIGPAVQYLRAYQEAPEGRREQVRTNLVQSLKTAALKSYWIGIDLTLGDYDAKAGGIPIQQYNFIPVPHSEDVSGVEPPHLAPVKAEDFKLLRLNADQAKSILSDVSDPHRFRAFIQVTPVGTTDGREGATLLISAPTEAIFGKRGPSGFPGHADLRIALKAPPRISGSAPAGDVAASAPKALMLDTEGVDLLALSRAPDLFDDTAFRRMLIERLVKERRFDKDAGKDASGLAPLAWGRFFTNPGQPLREADVTAMLPAFKKWTLARAQALPSRLVLPLGSPGNPVTECYGWASVWKPEVLAAADPVYKAAGRLLGSEVAIPDVTGGTLSVQGHSRPGPDLLWFFSGEPNERGAMDCSYMSGGINKLAVDARRAQAGYVSAFVSVTGQPEFGGLTDQPDSFLYTLSPKSVRLIRRQDAGPGMPEQLAAVLFITTDTDAAVAFKNDRFGGGYKTLASIKAGDWDLPNATKPAATDITGLSLDMPLADFAAGVLKRLPNALRFDTKVPGKGMFGHAVGFYDPSTKEMLVGVYADNVDGKPIVAVMRTMYLPAAAVPIEALKQSFIKKYGDKLQEDGSDYWVWGALPQSEDNQEVCGGAGLMRPPGTDEAPQLVPVEPDRLPEYSPVARPEAWTELGWPADRADQQPGFDISRCGPVVATSVSDNGDQLFVETWLSDRKLAGKYDAMPKPKPKPKATIDIKL